MALIKYRCGPAYPDSVIKKCNWLDMSPGPSVVVGSWALSKPSLIFIGPKIKARIICLPESELRPRPITITYALPYFKYIGLALYVYIYICPERVCLIIGPVNYFKILPMEMKIRPKSGPRS